MNADDTPSDQDKDQPPGRVLRFRQRRSADLTTGDGTAPVEGLGKYQGGREPDDYRHRMIINAVAFVFIAALIGAGLWLANSMAQIRKNQDCVLSGRRNCAPVEVNRERW